MTDADLIAHMHETTRRQDAEIATLRALLAEARPHVEIARDSLGVWGDTRRQSDCAALLTRIDAALSPAVPARPDLSRTESPPPAGDSGGRETV